jgi:hypothetical protein
MITKENFSTLLAAFCGLVERQQQDRLVAQGFTPERHNVKVITKTGRKFVNVDVGSSGKYMVEISTGNIFGIKAYGQVHRGHFYGTIETTGEYFWGNYYPERKGSPLLRSVPILTFAPKAEAVALNVDTVCPDGPTCADPVCRDERMKQGLAVA